MQPDTFGSGAGSDWREKYAYHVGALAYVYGFPVIHQSGLRYNMVASPTGQVDTPVNAYFHFRELADPATRYGGSPNVDTLYSVAQLDMSAEPLVLGVPPTDGRYYTLQLCEYYSDTFAYLGRRTIGPGPGEFLITGPDWQGEKPTGITEVFRSPTPWAFVMGRTEGHSAADLPAVHKIQDGYTIAPLSDWLRGVARPASARDVLIPYDTAADPLAEFKTMNEVMTQNPPPARDRALVTMFAQVGLGPGKTAEDIDRLDPGTKRGLARAVVDTKKLLVAVTKAGGNTKVVNGWAYGQQNWGRTARDGDFLGRAATQSLSGITENYPEESVKFRTYTDSDGRSLDGGSRYVIEFPPGQLPEAGAFWSLTAYGPDYNLIPNSADKYAIGDHAGAMQVATDGSLTIYVQKDSPGEAEASNWLPVGDGPFNLFLRAYQPGDDLINQTWTPPSVRRVGPLEGA